VTSLRWLGHHGNLHGVHLEGEKVFSAPVLPECCAPRLSALPLSSELALCGAALAPVLEFVSVALVDFLVMIHHCRSC